MPRDIPEVDPAKVAKLPIWAREHIRVLEMRTTEAQALVETLKGADPREPLAMRDRYQERVPVAWTKYDEIVFFPLGIEKENTWISARVRAPGSGEVEVLTSDTMHLRMAVSNSVYISTTRHP